MKFALIGHPVAGSLSPTLFSAAYDGRYSYDLLDFEVFEDAWNTFLAQYTGINVTAPFKQDAYAHVDWLSESARATGAVNLVVKADAGLRGYNTDVDGIVNSVREVGLPVADALVVGTGGAARAAIVAAQKLGCQVTVAGRSAEKVESLTRTFGCSDASLGEVPSLTPGLVIYTIPGGAPVPPGLNFAESVVLEAEYKRPALSTLHCKAYVPGKRWLLWQAAAGYELFTGEKPDMQNLFNAI
jgi:shikimate dehydrogenase